MTWTKLGAEYSDTLALEGVTDAEYRTHTEALNWLYDVEREDMRIPKHLVRRFAGSVEWEAAVAGLVRRGIWKDIDGKYEVLHHGDIYRQSLAAQQSKRGRDKDAQRRSRARARKSGQAVSGTDDDADRIADTEPDPENDTSNDANADVRGDTDRQTDRPSGSKSPRRTGRRSSRCGLRRLREAERAAQLASRERLLQHVSSTRERWTRVALAPDPTDRSMSSRPHGARWRAQVTQTGRTQWLEGCRARGSLK